MIIPVRTAMAAVLALLMAGCTGIATHAIEAERTEIATTPLKLSAKGLPDASIDLLGNVRIGSDDLALSDPQRARTLAYREAVIALVDLTLKDSERVANHAVATALFATGREDKAEQKIERQAGQIAHTQAFCDLQERVHDREDRMLEAVAQLRPYASANQQNAQECISG